MFYNENSNAATTNKSKTFIKGTEFRTILTYEILQRKNGCELRECSLDGKISCYEIYMDGEFLLKDRDKKRATSLFKDFSAG